MGISGFNKMMQKEFKKSFAQPKSDGGLHYKNNNNNNNNNNRSSNFTSSSSSSVSPDIKNSYKLDPKRLASFDHVYVDVNNVLHVAAHHTKTESAFYKKLFGLLTGIIRRTRPKHSITFALDGPAPMAKTITQRRRRVRLSSGEREPLSTDLSRMMKLGITPGSRLALKVDRAIEYYIASKVHREEFGADILYELSGTTVPGEGEIKLVRAMQLRQENPNFQNHTHCVVSEDSDAILLALTMNPTVDVFVSGAQRLVFSGRMFNEELVMSLDPNSKVLSSENNLSGAGATGSKSKKQAKREMEMNRYNQRRGGGDDGESSSSNAKNLNSNSNNNNSENSGNKGDDGLPWWNGILPDRKKHPKEYSEELSALRRDFVGLSVMSGNDYISGSRFGVKFSWRNYARVRSCKMFKGRNRLFPGPPSNSKDPLFQLRLEKDRSSQPMTGMDDTVNWAMLKAIAGTLLNPNYLEWLEEHDASAFKHTSKYASPLAKDMITIKDFTINYSTLANMPAEDFAHVWNNFSDVNEDNDSSVRRVYDYMYGVEWVLATYHAGECADFSFYTLYDSSSRPRSVNQVGGLGGNDLLDYASIPDTFDKNCDPLIDKTRAEAVFYNKAPITPLAYSLAVIPRGGRAQLCKGIQPLVDPDSSLRELFACDYCARCIKHRIKVAPLERTLQQQLSGNAAGKVGQKNKSARSVQRNASKQNRTRKSGNSSRIDELLAKKSPMYVEVLNDGDDSSDDISDVIIIEDEDEDEDIEDEDGDGGMKVFLSTDEDDEVSDDNVDASEYEDPPLEFPSKKTYKSYEEVRDELRRLNRNHLQHVKNAYVHVDKPPMSLPSLEAAVARLSADELLSKDEEVLRTIGSPVLYWKRKSLDTKDAEEQDFYTTREMKAWRNEITPPGCKTLTEGVTSIRRYDGDVARVLKEWRKRRFRGGRWGNQQQQHRKPQQRTKSSPPSREDQQQQRAPQDQAPKRKFTGGRGGRGASSTSPGRSGARRANPRPPKALPPSAVIMMHRVAF